MAVTGRAGLPIARSEQGDNMESCLRGASRRIVTGTTSHGIGLAAVAAFASVDPPDLAPPDPIVAQTILVSIGHDECDRLDPDPSHEDILPLAARPHRTRRRWTRSVPNQLFAHVRAFARRR